MVFNLAGFLLRSGLFMPDAALSTTDRAWWQGERARLSLVPGATFAVCRRALRGRKG
jgi:hypothetical protein